MPPQGVNAPANDVTDLGYNIDDDGSCGFTSPSISDSAMLDGTLGSLANNGGPTQTIALEPGSPAIGLVTNPSQCPATDRGMRRGPTRVTPVHTTPTEPRSTPPSPPSPSGGPDRPAMTVTGIRIRQRGRPRRTGVLAHLLLESDTGSDYDNFSFSDLTEGWLAGRGSNCTGVSITSYSATPRSPSPSGTATGTTQPTSIRRPRLRRQLPDEHARRDLQRLDSALLPTPTISSVTMDRGPDHPDSDRVGVRIRAQDDLVPPVPARLRAITGSRL